jgi:excisionase family DNA binding protein
MSDLILHQTPLSEITALFGLVVEEKLKGINLQHPQPKTEYLTRQETAQLLGVTLPTLHEWTKNGTIQGTRIGTRVRYRLADVEASLKDIQNVKSKRR